MIEAIQGQGGNAGAHIAEAPWWIVEGEVVHRRYALPDLEQLSMWQRDNNGWKATGAFLDIRAPFPYAWNQSELPQQGTRAACAVI